MDFADTVLELVKLVAKLNMQKNLEYKLENLLLILYFVR